MPDRRPDPVATAASKATRIAPTDWVDRLVANPAGLVPGTIESTEPMLHSLGKPLQELLDLALRPTTAKTGLPRGLRLTNWDARTGEAAFRGLRKGGAEEFRASPQQLDDLIGGGALDVQQPPTRAVEAIRRRLAALLGQ